MANTIKIKQSSVADKVPLAGDLVQGELAVNTLDEKLYMKNSTGSVIELGGRAFTNSSTPPSSPSLGDNWFDPSTERMYTRVSDASNVDFWWSHTEHNTNGELNGGNSQAYTYSAGDIYDGGDAASTYIDSVNGGTA